MYASCQYYTTLRCVNVKYFIKKLLYNKINLELPHNLARQLLYILLVLFLFLLILPIHRNNDNYYHRGDAGENEKGGNG